ncbi:9428_t:CDS:2 [Ambispora leptoticha]|uniref:Endoplasmic reticulum junction formation protein lunapark n=1 Tax=Ambispora leptoticha TaxID=144679 RepID=A0A9N8ZP61_9GLOM|nr:9428_t:CDS:2 [Ambispora leptoticha]
MGGVISRFRAKEDDNYEKILSELDNNIRLAEVRLAEIKIRERRAMIIWLVNSTLIYIIYVIGYLYFAGQTPESDNWDVWAIKVAPVFTVPALILIVKNLMAIWYKRSEANEESQLRHLRAKQKLKVEELKKKTGYYTTKTLLERYDSPKSPQGPQPPLTPGTKTQVSRSGSAPGQTPVNQNLRQRPTHAQTTPMPSNNIVNGLNGDTPKASILEGGSDITPGSSIHQRSYTFPNSPSPLQRHWYDKLVDVIVGDEGPETKYALICENCHVHNGLVLPQEVDDLQYICPKCNHFNPSRRSIREGTAGNNSLLLSSKSALNPDKDSTKISDIMTPRRGRSTTPRPTSRESSSDPEHTTKNYDEFEDDGVAVNDVKKYGSSSSDEAYNDRDALEN